MQTVDKKISDLGFYLNNS